eukprot:51876_1
MSAFEPRWIDDTKALLLAIEHRNIETRSQRWEQLVNQRTIDLQTQIFGNNPYIRCSPCSLQYDGTLSEDDLKHALQFLHDWKGLKTPVPTRYTEYQLKSRNWANGRRAKGCADTVFPLFIYKTETYADAITSNTFDSDHLNRLYFKTLMYGYLHTLCEAKVRVTSARRVWLLCDNSLKSNKTKLKRILQSYAPHCAYPEAFPAHRPMAMDYFIKEMNLCKDELMQGIRENATRKPHVNHDNKLIIQPFNVVFEAMTQLMNAQHKQQFVLSNISGRITTIEENANTTDNWINIQKYLEHMK